MLLPRRGVFIKVKKSPSGKEENDNSNKHNNKNPEKKKFRYAREIKLRNNNKKRKGEKNCKNGELACALQAEIYSTFRENKKKGGCLRKK